MGLLKLIPGTRRELLAFMADHYDGLVIEGFGVGGLPEYDGFYDVVRQAAEAGKLIVMTTQVPNEGSDLTVYHVGGHLKHTLQVLEAYDMTTESAVCQAHVDPGPDPGLRPGGKAVLHPGLPGHSPVFRGISEAR